MTRSYLQPNPKLDAVLLERSQRHPICARVCPKYGNHCRLHALPGSDFCEKHQPKQEAKP